jgi:hypothetical protein
VTEPQHEFSPDWTLAPAAHLREWMQTQIPGMHLTTFALICAGRGGDRDKALPAIQDVLDRRPLTDVHARLLARGTGVPERFWLSLERGYRRDLELGRKDTT